jgi:uncharacterized protein (TIGR00162 family)
MMKTEIRILKRPTLKEPRLVGGLPGSGYVAKLVVDHLVKETNAELFAEIYSYSFPPQVIVKEDGTIELMKNELYFAKNRGNGDLIILNGNAQAVSPEGQYDLSDKALDFVKELGVQTVYMTAAYITGEHVKKPKIYGTATHLASLGEIEKFGVTIMKEGSITGTNGLLFGLAKQKNMTGICLLGETSGYIVDARAAQVVLEVLAKMLDFKVDMTNLENKAKETEKLLKKVEEMERRAMEQQAGFKAPPIKKPLEYIS